MKRVMKLPAGTVLAVALRWDAQTEVAVGRLAMRDHLALFEFDRQFLVDGVELSPLRLRRQPGVVETREPLFENLPGVFNDSLPDGWGRRLLDRAARRKGVPPQTLTPIDRLAHVGSDGIGALVYRPEIPKDAPEEAIDLDVIAGQSRAVLVGESDDLLDRLRKLGGSPQGARPKVLLQIDAGGRMTDAQSDCGPGWRHFIVKFPAQADFPDIGAVELAHAHMAVACGIRMPEVRLLPSQSGPGYFAAGRFDRDGAQRLHVATAAGLLHADYRMPSLDYVDLAKLAVRLTQDHSEGEQLFRLMAFNVLAHNRDDHAKQFSFLMNRAGAWSMAPAYDLTFSHGMAGAHTTSIAGEGKAPQLAHMLKVADAAGLKHAKAKDIVAQVRQVVAMWRKFAGDAGVSTRTTATIETTLNRS
jgi:serine/threonine-protein kinase HipA